MYRQTQIRYITKRRAARSLKIDPFYFLTMLSQCLMLRQLESEQTENKSTLKKQKANSVLHGLVIFSCVFCDPLLEIRS